MPEAITEQLPLVPADVAPGTNAEPATDKKAEPPKQETKTLMREFSFQLTDADLAKKATQLGELSAELDAATAKLDSAKGVFKSAEAQIKAATRDIIDSVRTRRELRTVWCEEVRDFEHGRVFWRPKNGDGILGERAMTAEERQMALKLDEKKIAENEKKIGAEYEQAAKDQPAEPAQVEITTAAAWDEAQANRGVIQQGAENAQQGAEQILSVPDNASDK